MSTKTIGFVGGGRITRIFLEGWRRANALPANVLVSDCNADTLAKLQAQFPGVQTTGDSHAAAAQDIVFLAVHPPVIKNQTMSRQTNLATPN
jgi:pyrroline-5-carboxylate reductase